MFYFTCDRSLKDRNGKQPVKGEGKRGLQVGAAVSLIVACRHLDEAHVPCERSMAQLRVQMEIIGQLEAQVCRHHSRSNFWKYSDLIHL